MRNMGKLCFSLSILYNITYIIESINKKLFFQYLFKEISIAVLKFRLLTYLMNARVP
jgi:hypothetical protein